MRRAVHCLWAGQACPANGERSRLDEGCGVEKRVLVHREQTGRTKSNGRQESPAAHSIYASPCSAPAKRH